MREWIDTAIHCIVSSCVLHRNYVRAERDMYNALAVAEPGEVVVCVGPSRVGKSRVVKDAVKEVAASGDARTSLVPYVYMEAENESTGGAYSTKSFMREACRAIKHPIYGVTSADDEWNVRLDARINRTPEGMLRDAFEHGLRLQRTRYLVIDEAHHVIYANGRSNGPTAILDSWKCLASKTGVVLCLVGPYQLLNLMAQTTHMLGRQRTIEFPRYRLDSPDDVKAFQQVLSTWGAHFELAKNKPLGTLGRQLFTHSFGCVGHLKKWLISALAYVKSRDLNFLTQEVLRVTQLPTALEGEILAEIENGEWTIARGDEPRAPSRTAREAPSATKRKRKPFRRAKRRFPLNGRI